MKIFWGKAIVFQPITQTKARFKRLDISKENAGKRPEALPGLPHVMDGEGQMCGESVQEFMTMPEDELITCLQDNR